MAAAVYFPQDLAMSVFHYEQQEDEPVNNNSNGGNGVHVFHLTVKPEYHNCIIAKLNDKFGDGFEYVEAELYSGFKNDAANVYIYFSVNLPMTQLFAIDQGLVDPELSEAERQAHDQKVYSHITAYDADMEFMDDDIVLEAQELLETCTQQVRAQQVRAQQVQTAGSRRRRLREAQSAGAGRHRKLSRRTRRRRTATKNGRRGLLFTRRRR